MVVVVGVGVAVGGGCRRLPDADVDAPDNDAPPADTWAIALAIFSKSTATFRRSGISCWIAASLSFLRDPRTFSMRVMIGLIEGIFAILLLNSHESRDLIAYIYMRYARTRICPLWLLPVSTGKVVMKGVS